MIVPLGCIGGGGLVFLWLFSFRFNSGIRETQACLVRFGQGHGLFDRVYGLLDKRAEYMEIFWHVPSPMQSVVVSTADDYRAVHAWHVRVSLSRRVNWVSRKKKKGH